MIRKYLFLVLCFGLSHFFVIQKSYALTCYDVREILSDFLKSHISKKVFDDSLNEKSIENYLKILDPARLYFLNEDYEKIKNLSKDLRKKIMLGDCSQIESIYGIYSKRYYDRNVDIKKFVEGSHDFSKEEYIEFKKETEYVTESEVKEKWRKRIKYQFLQLKNTVKDEKKAREKLLKRFELSTMRLKEYTTNDIYGFYLKGFASSIDPHSSYFPPEELADFRIQTKLSLFGIGAVLNNEDGITVIRSLVEGGGAKKSGLTVGDKIIAVTQCGAISGKNEEEQAKFMAAMACTGESEDVIDKDIHDVVEKIRGPEGTVVGLTIQRDGVPGSVLYKIRRQQIQLKDKMARSFVFDTEVKTERGVEKHAIGWLDLPSFYIDFEGRSARMAGFRSSSRDVAVELEKLKKQNVDCVVVDLSANPGGSLDEAINIAGLFTGVGPVVQIKGEGKPIVRGYEEKALYDGCLVVLIDRLSASASEILAGAIKDDERGLIIGNTKTFGKGSVQNLVDLEQNKGAFKVTISMFYTPSGSSTQLRGVASDIILPSVFEHSEIGEEFYEGYLPWDRVPEAKHPRFGKVVPYVKTVAERSQKRIGEDKGFVEIKKAIEEFQEEKKKGNKISLKEDKKAKDKKPEELTEPPLVPTGEERPRLSENPYLRESLRIATDYARLSVGKGMGEIIFPELIAEEKMKAAKNNKSKSLKNAKKKAAKK